MKNTLKMSNNIIKINIKDMEIFESIINLKNVQRIHVVYEDDIIAADKFLETLNKNKEKLNDKAFYEFRNAVYAMGSVRWGWRRHVVLDLGATHIQREA